MDKQQRWQPHPQPAPLPSTLALDANFRSAPGVIAGINYLFETFFSRGLGGVDYGDGQRLVVGGDKDAAYQGMCEIDVIDGADVDGDAAVIARRIAEMVGQGFPVRGKDGPRPCRYDDFCILLRGRKGFAAYEGALRTAGIPVFADSATDLLDEPHIRPFAALLRVIDNPAQDIPLAAVLLSPMFPYTADDLVALRRARPTGSLYGAVLYSEPQRFALFTDALTEYRRLARTLPVDELIVFFNGLQLDEHDTKTAARILIEIRSRLQYLADVGLGYLTLDRLSSTLSGGESQRINLSTSLGSNLTGSLYILDEPSIGLHPRDTNRLIKVLRQLRDLGNTVIVVEHEEEVIRAADYIVDIGPKAGYNGGEVVFSGTLPRNADGAVRSS